ncbi:hypothetical protein ACTQW9_10610 [Lachnospiraceae bacterium LCP19S3_B12]
MRGEVFGYPDERLAGDGAEQGRASLLARAVVPSGTARKAAGIYHPLAIKP